MALNAQALKTRSLSAVFFVLVMAAGLLISHWTFFLLFSIIHFGCWAEYQRLIVRIDPAYEQVNFFHRYGMPLLGWGFMLWMTGNAYQLGGVYLHELGWWLILLLLVTLPIAEVLLSRQLNLQLTGYSLLGLLYLSLSWGLMIGLRNNGLSATGGWLTHDWGWLYPAVLLAAIWINDTMAYLVGSLIGKTPFSAISPKKTWEGTAGGAVLAIVAITAIGYACGLKELRTLIAIASIAAVTGTLGDLLESKLKRMAGVKDSGNMMPGHGGFLDRFDSLLLATPVVWLYLQLFG